LSKLKIEIKDKSSKMSGKEMAAVPIFYFMKHFIDQIKWGIGPGGSLGGLA
jgi:hypothetical protein